MSRRTIARPSLCVLHVNAGNLYGGVERIFVTLARQRSLCQDMQPRFALCFDGPLRMELEASGCPVHVLGEVRLRYPWQVWRARRRLDDLLRKEAADVVVCHSAWVQAVLGPAARRRGAPLVYWLHGQSEGRQAVERLARRTRPDLVLGASRATTATASNLYPAVRAEVYYAPLTREPAEFERVDRAAVRAEHATDPHDTVIIQVSRMEPGKGHRMHIEALARLRDLPGWTAWFVGGTERPEEVSYLASLKELAAQSGIGSRLRFLGRRTDAPRLLTAADVFCQPNIYTEGFSIAFTEAFLARLPIVTSAIGGALEIVDASCGILLEPGDIPGLERALRALVLDPERRGRLGEAGHRRVLEICEPRRQLSRLRELLASVAANGLRGNAQRRAST